MSEKKQRNWLVWAVVGTLAYVGVLGYGLGFSAIRTFLSNPKLNEFGDFLAGTFAPLALFWLVAAVLTQRQELDDARTQFKKNQEVTEAQLNTVRQQNEFAAKQSDRNYKLNLFEPRFEVFEEVDKIARSIPNGQPAAIAEEAAATISVLAHRSMFIFSKTVSEQLMEIAGLFEQIAAERVYFSVATTYDEFTNAEQHNQAMTTQVEWERTRERFYTLCNEVSAKLSFANRTLIFEDYLTVTDAIEGRA